MAYSPATKIDIVSVGTKMPQWIEQGISLYLERTPWNINLIEISPAKRNKSYIINNAIKQEEAAIQKYLNKQSTKPFIITLEISGKNISTEELAKKLDLWFPSHNHFCIIIGGADGLGMNITKLSNFKWSLSKLTFPHMLARLIVTEQLYRAWSVLSKHPYHK